MIVARLSIIVSVVLPRLLNSHYRRHSFLVEGRVHQVVWLFNSFGFTLFVAFSALKLLVGHQEEHPACKNWVMRCWCGYLSGARCRLFAYGPTDATASQNPVISCPILIQTGFTFLVPAHPGSPRKRAVKCVCVRACVRAVMGMIVLVLYLKESPWDQPLNGSYAA